MREGLDDAMLMGLKMKEGAVSLGMQIMKKAQKWIPPPPPPELPKGIQCCLPVPDFSPVRQQCERLSSRTVRQ